VRSHRLQVTATGQLPFAVLVAADRQLPVAGSAEAQLDLVGVAMDRGAGEAARVESPLWSGDHLLGSALVSAALSDLSSTSRDPSSSSSGGWRRSSASTQRVQQHSGSVSPVFGQVGFSDISDKRASGLGLAPVGRAIADRLHSLAVPGSRGVASLGQDNSFDS
jgi:hypothetical protein